MDPTWLASLFGPNALDTSQFTGGTLSPSFDDRYNNLLPFATPTVGVGGQGPTPTIVPSAAPTAPGGVPNPPAMPPAVAPAQPTALAGLQNKAEPDNNLVAALRGITAPAPPVAQKITTPHPPPPGHAQALQIANLLASLGIGPSRLPTLGTLRGA